MDKAIKTLQQRLLPPSPNTLQDNSICGICWTDYDGDSDRPVTLPCGHVFGEDCILAWARGTTPNGRYNGCPTCRAELLPPSLHSRSQGLVWYLTMLWHSFLTVLGDPIGEASSSSFHSNYAFELHVDSPGHVVWLGHQTRCPSTNATMC